jgi:hypothetical protein
MTTMHPLFAQILSVMEPAPTCRKCHGSGETGSGRECNWCAPVPPDDPEDEARELAGVAAAEREWRARGGR